MGNESSSAAAAGPGASPVRRATARPEYTIRVVVRGERMAGKTSLVRMLLGEPFVPEYEPTPAIAASSLDWCFKSTNEQVRCVLWDVVEQTNRTRAKPASQELKLVVKEAKAGSVTLGEADAQTVDVLRGAHAIFVVFDPHKRWTFDFCQRQLESSPPELDVLVISNFRDGETGVEVSAEEAKSLVSRHKNARFLECSCRNGFGKTQILSFLNLPFLRVQREHLTALLARNASDFQLATEEFDLISFEIDYKAHLKWAEAERAPVVAEKKKSLVPTPAPVATVAAAAAAVASPPPKPVVVSPKMPNPVPLPVELAEDENLDAFLQKVRTDGWGETIESEDENSSSDNEMVRQPKLTEAGKREPPKAAPPKLEEMQAKKGATDDGSGETVVSSDSEDNNNNAKAPAPVAPVAVRVAEPSVNAQAVTAALEEARRVAEEQAAAARAATAAAAAAATASPPVPAKKKKAGAKKKTKKGSSAAGGAAPSAPRRDDYAQL